MVFYPPSWVPKLPELPDANICDVMLDDRHGRHPLEKSRPPFTCAFSGKEYTWLEVKKRTGLLARALSKELGFPVNQGSEYDKVIGIFSFNTIDTLTLTWATHRLNGISTPANAAYSSEELAYQIKDSGAKCLFTTVPQLEVARKACKQAGIPENRMYLLEVPKEMMGGASWPQGMKTLDDFIKEGENLPELEPLRWEKGQSARQTAFLCYSSGTSGLPKGVMIAHKNVIANTIQMALFEEPFRSLNTHRKPDPDGRETALGLLPMSHIYGLIVVCHSNIYRGDRVIVLPKFEFQSYLGAIQRFKIVNLYLVPPIIITMTKNKTVMDKYDLSSVCSIFTGAAPLGGETAQDLQNIFPSWAVKQGYGLTESCTVVCATDPRDIVYGSSGSLLPGYEAKIMSPEGKEITEYDVPGELVVRSPSVTLGYLHNKKATEETFIDEDGGRWAKTGDEAVVRKSEKSGNEHIWIVDRIKELIKVKGLQVAPAELEAHLLTHPAVNDCAVIPVPDDQAGEVPKAFVVKAPGGALEDSDRLIMREIQKHVEQHKARHKWLKGGVEFIDVIPKSPSGKILRRMLRDKEKETRRKMGARL